MNNGLLIGIDGGATHSTAVAVLPDGNAVAVAYGEGLNFNNVGTEKVRLRIESIVREIQEKTGMTIDCVCIGSAALDFAADIETTRKFTGLLTEEQIDLQSDAYAALMGLTRGKPGMIAICGTGSMLMLADSSGNQYISGGWGYLMEDSGSGYALARQGLIAVINEYEGTGEPTSLSRHACNYFDADDLRRVIDKLYAPDFTPDMLAGFARYVIAEAENGDEICTEIIRRNMTHIAHQAAELFKKAPEAVHAGLYGGIFAHSALAKETFETELLSRMPGAVICSPEYTPELGAVIHLMQKRGILTEDALKNMKESYERIRK